MGQHGQIVDAIKVGSTFRVLRLSYQNNLLTSIFDLFLPSWGLRGIKRKERTNNTICVNKRVKGDGNSKDSLVYYMAHILKPVA
jgi:hypothetical protein